MILLESEEWCWSLFVKQQIRLNLRGQYFHRAILWSSSSGDMLEFMHGYHSHLVEHNTKVKERSYATSLEESSHGSLEEAETVLKISVSILMLHKSLCHSLTAVPTPGGKQQCISFQDMTVAAVAGGCAVSSMPTALWKKRKQNKKSSKAI